MATEVDKLLVRVEADLGDLKKGLKQLDTRLKQTEDRTRGAFNKIAGFAKLALGGVLVHQTAQAGLALVNFASHVEEAQAKSSVVFGQFTGDVRKQLEQFASEVGRSAFALEEMASKVQDTFVPMGFARGEAAQLSIQLAKLATDVASFNNASDTETMAAFQSAIVGNHETVRQFGIVITEATLNQELLRMGLTKTSQTASNAQKVQARLNLIMAGTTDAQGDAARTADSFANRSKALQAALENLAVGTITPMLDDLADFVKRMTDATNAMHEFLKEIGLAQLSETEEHTRNLTDTTEDLIAAQKELAHLEALKKFKQEAPPADQALAALAGRMTDIAGKEFGPIELALSIKQIDKQIAEAEAAVKAAMNVLAQVQADAFDMPLIQGEPSDTGPDIPAKAQADATKAITNLQNKNALLRDELSGVNKVQLAVNEALQKHTEAGTKNREEIEKEVRANEALKFQLEQKIEQEKIASELAEEKKQRDEEYIDTITEMSDALTLLGMEASGATEKEIEAMKVRLENKGLSEEQIQVLIELKNIELELGEAIEKTTEAEKEKNDAINRAKSHVESLVTEEAKLVKLQEDLKVAFAEGKISEEQFREGMADLEHELAMLNPVFAEMVNGIDRAMGQMADSIAEGVMEGKLSLDSFQDIARNFVQGLIAEFIKTYVIKSIMRSAMGFMGFDAGMLGIGQSAGGGAIHPSTPKIVGERGPELFIPHSAGNIVNNANSKSALGGGPSVVVNQNINVETGVSQTVRAEMISLLPQIQESTISAVIDSRQRGGAVATAFGA